MFVDFKKAFDLIDPKLLFFKLFHYGFDNSALSLARSYFDGRRQATKVSEICSEPLDLLIGLPQGSVLGPIVFLIFINDLPFMLSLATTLFADDTTIYTSIDSVNIEVVSSFKLLGVMIDRKLDFHNHVDVLKTLVNRKLFSYKKLFFLSFATKVQFFKTFILPHFDYCFPEKHYII